MTVKLTSFARAVPLGLLVAFGVVSTASGDAGPQRDSSADALSGAQAEVQLVGHLQELEAGRRKVRKQALKEPQSWAANRPIRAAQHRQQITQLWGNAVGSLDAQPSLRMNADHMARLNRMLDIAQEKGDAAMVSRLQADTTRELARHVHAMQQVTAASVNK